jgi:hypothetical protein
MKPSLHPRGGGVRHREGSHPPAPSTATRGGVRSTCVCSRIYQARRAPGRGLFDTRCQPAAPTPPGVTRRAPLTIPPPHPTHTASPIRIARAKMELEGAPPLDVSALPQTVQARILDFLAAAASPAATAAVPPPQPGPVGFKRGWQSQQWHGELPIPTPTAAPPPCKRS